MLLGTLNSRNANAIEWGKNMKESRSKLSKLVCLLQDFPEPVICKHLCQTPRRDAECTHDFPKVLSEVKWKLLSRVRLFVTPWTLQPWNSLGQSTGVGSLSLHPGDFPNPGIEPRSPALQGDSLPAEPQGKPIYDCVCIQSCKDK